MFDWIFNRISTFREEGNLNNVWWVLFALVVTFLVLMGTCQIANAQPSVDGDVEGHLEVWPRSERCYQHAMEATGGLTAQWGMVKFGWDETFRWWGNCDSKMIGSFLNAESGMGIERTRDVKLLFGDYKDMWFGSRVHRSGIHHIWRNKAEKADRYNGWVRGDWRQGIEDCQNNEPLEGDLSCGSIGYWDRVGPTVVYNPSWGHFEATWLVYQWKDLTLPPNDAMFEGRVNFANNWTTGTRIEHSVRNNIYYTGRILYGFDTVSVGLRGGKLKTPGWRVDDPIEFVAIVLKIQ